MSMMSSSNNNNVNNNVVDEHQEGVILYNHVHTYPCGSYYVQSPSTQNDAESTSAFQSPTRPGYFSSRGSTHSFCHNKKISYDATTANGDDDDDADIHRLIVEEEEDDVSEYEWRRRRRYYCTYRNTDSCAWIWLQILWRLFVSFGVAFIFFYISTKPPPPSLSLQIHRIEEFKLGEGVDRSGVVTKILTCNCSMNLHILNKSKFFVLHIAPPTIHMSFGTLPFALSHGPKLEAESGTTTFGLEVGTKNKAMYGAGRNMQDMLDSGRGLPIHVTVRTTSSFRVVPNLINPTFHHQLQCILFLNKSYDKKHRTQAFNGTCTL